MSSADKLCFAHSYTGSIMTNSKTFQPHTAPEESPLYRTATLFIITQAPKEPPSDSTGISIFRWLLRSLFTITAFSIISLPLWGIALSQTEENIIIAKFDPPGVSRAADLCQAGTPVFMLLLLICASMCYLWLVICVLFAKGSPHFNLTQLRRSSLFIERQCCLS